MPGNEGQSILDTFGVEADVPDGAAREVILSVPQAHSKTQHTAACPAGQNTTIPDNMLLAGLDDFRKSARRVIMVGQPQVFHTVEIAAISHSFGCCSCLASIDRKEDNS